MSSGWKSKSFSFWNRVAIDGTNLFAATLNSSAEFITTLSDLTSLWPDEPHCNYTGVAYPYNNFQVTER